ncbi:winged helix-turn-helix transcriptional regulator [Actinomadura atramentaria]|uniref:winged helix-turn-helix transcriptional regulator n=1 Tax=Actinomadura atramentaria TaxID=1990 RepID=UPI00036577E2|nr:helix-turn-helix domain-containing protein [Actinomadura atramentaria]
MAKDSDPRECSIADALQIIGERWSLLIIRELVYGVRRFDGIARNTGGPRDILTARLRKLETAGIVRRELYNERPARYEYHLTDAGRELSDVLAVLMRWGDRHLNPEDPPVRWIHTCGEVLEPEVVCACCGRPAREGGTPTGRGARV